jgi:hypothetical protein
MNRTVEYDEYENIIYTLAWYERICHREHDLVDWGEWRRLDSKIKTDNVIWPSAYINDETMQYFHARNALASRSTNADADYEQIADELFDTALKYTLGWLDDVVDEVRIEFAREDVKDAVYAMVERFVSGDI